MKDRVFNWGVGFLFTHELDAVLNHEWRVLPLTSWLPEDIGQIVFIIAHLPLFAVLLGLIASENPATRNRTKFWVSAFLVLHAVLHALFMVHAQYEFDSWLSSMLIGGGAVCGGWYLLLDRRDAKHVDG